MRDLIRYRFNKMKTFKCEVWYRYGDNEKDFFHVEVEALNWESAEKQIKETNRRIFKIEKL